MGLHWFLPASLLPPTLLPGDPAHSHCHCCNPSTTRRSKKTVSDIFTWALCFNRYTAALCTIYPGMLPQMMAYENTILQAHLQFTGEGWRIYDRAFRVQAASRRTTDWQSVDASLYARFVACQPRRSSVCQFCCSSGHKSSTCAWGVDDSASLHLHHASMPLQHWAQHPTLGPSASLGMRAPVDTLSPAATAMSAPPVLLRAIALQSAAVECHLQRGCRWAARNLTRGQKCDTHTIYRAHSLYELIVC